MKRLRGRPVIASDDEIIAAYERCQSLRRAAEHLGYKSFQAVAKRLKAAGYEQRYGSCRNFVRTLLSEQQCRAAYDSIVSGNRRMEVAKRTGVGIATLRREMDKYGLWQRLRSHKRRAWSDNETAVVERHYKRGKSASQIAHMLGRSRNEVIGKAHRMGL